MDFHTGGTGGDFALFVFAYAKDAESLRMAELFPVDQIMADPGLPGTLEYALVQAGIPALTIELGKRWATDMPSISNAVISVSGMMRRFRFEMEAGGGATGSRRLTAEKNGSRTDRYGLAGNPAANRQEGLPISNCRWVFPSADYSAASDQPET